MRIDCIARCRVAALAIAILFVARLVPCAAAQDSPAPDTKSVAQLAAQQEQLAERYRKIEELLLRLADVEAAENPERAALLRRAARQSRDKFILDRLTGAAGSLTAEQYQKALDDQKAAHQELASLLKLLMTEDRPQRIRQEKDRIANLIKDLKRMERGERSTRARTENGAELDEVAKEQQAITERARQIEADLKENAAESEPDAAEPIESQPSESEPSESEPSESEPSESEPSESEPSESEPSESEPSESEPSESEPSESEPSESEPSESEPSESEPSESEPSESEPSESEPSESEPSESQPSESQPSDSQPSESQPSESQQPPQSPQEAAEQAVEKARRRMEQAEKNLKEAKRKPAVEAQRQAEQELREAIAKLEQILRQLREEEMLRELARLESRLRQMAQMQSTVLDTTKQLSMTAPEQRDRQTDIRAGNLALDEKKIVVEADRAILLLREEGSSVAFPEVIEQMRDDMTRVADRLSQTKIDVITQGIQEDILAALQEMIEALQQAQRDLEQQQQQQQQQAQQSGEPGEQPLVQTLAELKLIRTIQTRIKSTTERYGDLVEGQDGVADEDVLGLLQSLSARQQKLYRVTRDLLLRRNN